MKANAAPDVLQHVSTNLRHARQAAGLSQEALAQASGVSRRMLVGLEKGDANVSLATLDRIARSLGVTFAELVRPSLPDGREVPVLAWRGTLEGSRAFLLHSHRVAAGAFEMWEWRLAPGERYEASDDPLGFHEMFYVVDGVLTLDVAGKRHVVSCGQSFMFASHQPNAYINAGDTACTFVKNVVAIYT